MSATLPSGCRHTFNFGAYHCCASLVLVVLVDMSPPGGCLFQHLKVIPERHELLGILHACINKPKGNVKNTQPSAAMLTSKSCKSRLERRAGRAEAEQGSLGDAIRLMTSALSYYEAAAEQDGGSIQLLVRFTVSALSHVSCRAGVQELCLCLHCATQPVLSMSGYTMALLAEWVQIVTKLLTPDKVEYMQTYASRKL